MKAFSAVLLLAALSAVPLTAADERLLKDNAGNTIIRYVVEAPPGIAPASETDPARQVGLFLCFPEHDHATGDEILSVRESLRRQGIGDRYVLLAGHPQAQKFSLADHEPIQKLMEWAMKTYPINPRRVYMYGKGEGAKVSAEFAMAHPKLVTAAITYSWGWWVMPPELTEPLDLNGAPEFYTVLGLRDLKTHIDTVRDTYSRMQAKGYHMIYREFADLGARTYHPPSNDDAIAWAVRLRNKNLPLSPGERRLLNGSAGELALVGGAPAAAAIQKLLQSKDGKVRTAAAGACAQAVFNEETIAAFAPVAADPEPRVRHAALAALALNAGWRSAAAQRILIDLASQPGDRAAAVDSLGLAVKFQIAGVRQDPPVFRALVALLDDKDEEIRAMAANILAPIRDPDFRGDAGRPERKAPEGGWAEWLDGISTLNAGYAKDYEVCRFGDAAPPVRSGEPVDLFCTGGAYLTGVNKPRQPALAFQNTLRAAELGYVPAQAAVGMMYANGTGTPQDYAEAGKWWNRAAAAGHPLAARNAARVPKTPAKKP